MRSITKEPNSLNIDLKPNDVFEYPVVMIVFRLPDKDSYTNATMEKLTISEENQSST